MTFLLDYTQKKSNFLSNNLSIILMKNVYFVKIEKRYRVLRVNIMKTLIANFRKLQLGNSTQEFSNFFLERTHFRLIEP